MELCTETSVLKGRLPRTDISETSDGESEVAAGSLTPDPDDAAGS